MPELNKANRQVCDVDIRSLKTMEPFMFFDTANTTTVGLTGDAVYAMKKGTRAIAFQNPIEGTLTIEAQVVPFKVYALLSDGLIETTAARAVKLDAVAEEDGKVALPEVANGYIKDGSVFVYPKGLYGDSLIEGEVVDGVFIPSTESDVKSGDEFEIGCMAVKEYGVRKVSFNNRKTPQDYFITMSTLDKDEDGAFTPFVMTAYKASIHREFELSFSSEGDPATLTLTFDLMEDKNGNVLDILEDLDEEIAPAEMPFKPVKYDSQIAGISVSELAERDFRYEWADRECRVSGGVKYISIADPQPTGEDGAFPDDYHQAFFSPTFTDTNQSGHFIPLSFDESMKGKDLVITDNEAGGRHMIHITVPSDLSIALNIDGWNTKRLDMRIGSDLYKIDLGGAEGVNTYPVGEKAMDHAEATSEEFGSASDYFSGVTRTWSGTSCRVEGTLRHQKKGSHSGIWKDGNFFAFRLSKAYQGKEITLEHGGEVRKKAVDTEWVVAVDDKSERIRALWGDLLIADFDLSGVTLGTESGSTPILTDPQKVKAEKPSKAAKSAKDSAQGEGGEA